jgi:hypothetical protein
VISLLLGDYVISIVSEEFRIEEQAARSAADEEIPWQGSAEYPNLAGSPRIWRRSSRTTCSGPGWSSWTAWNSAWRAYAPRRPLTYHQWYISLM